MIRFKRGDVVLVEFIFSERIGTKRRPALVISSNDYHKTRQELIVTAITSNIKRVLFGETKIDKWKQAGLTYPSLVTEIIQTIKGNMIIRKLGALSKQDFQKVQKNLRKIIVF